MNAEVIISGAGPAGVATAVALVRGGMVAPERIVCFDRAHFPRPKPCGGGLTGHAESAMQALGLRLRVPSVACPDGRLVFGTLTRKVPLPRPVRIVRRDDFDADLVEQARALGVAVEEGEGLASFAVANEDAAVLATTTKGRTLRGRVLVAADGAGSLIRRALVERAGFTRVPLRLARLELTVPARAPTTMIYDFSAFSRGLRGYVWLFPAPGDRVNVGIMHDPSAPGAERLGGRSLDTMLAATLARHGVSLPGAARGWPAWGYHPRGPVAAPHLLCVGDAAGIDGLTGEGIAVGLEHGRIAAAAIGAALASGNFAFAGYRQAIRRQTVGRELAVDRWLAALLYASADFKPWLSLVMFDRGVQELYAARVSGEAVLADRKASLVAALGRQLFLGQKRIAELDAAS